MKNESTIIDVPAESSSAMKGSAPLIGMAKDHTTSDSGGYKRGLSIFDFLLRLAAIIASSVAAGTMFTSDETLPFFTQFLQFQAGYDDLPTFQLRVYWTLINCIVSLCRKSPKMSYVVFRFFVIAMSMISGYLVLSLPFSVVTIIRPLAVAPRLLLLVLDTVHTR